MKWLSGLTVACALLGAVGCGVGPGQTSTGGGAGSSSSGSGGASPCDDPTLGPVAEDCGIWVSASKGDDSHAGTQAAPVASLARAVELAAKGSGHVYACAETWTDPLVLPGNIGLHGGFDCDHGWAYLGKQKRSVLAPGPDVIALLASDGGDSSKAGKATVTDFHIEAADAVKPGGSSIGVFIRDNVSLWLYRCEVIAGNGANGADGEPPGQSAAAGTPGNPGADACSAATNKGGVSPATGCEAGGTSKGGAGGDSGPLLAKDGEAGEPASGTPGAGAGGLGEQNTPSCTNGKPGADGQAGAFGTGGGQGKLDITGKPHLTLDGYVGIDGEDGSPGAPGQGGGGGGARFGSAAVCGASKAAGASGGSGGSGGCGGKGGKGGRAGGASVAVLMLNHFGFFETVMTTHNGGRGGDGAPGQEGGDGGAGGKGGAGSGTLQAACAGGAGGKGGKGGWGGGGRGGDTSVIVIRQNGVLGFDHDDFSELHPGKAGQGGSGDPMQLDGWGVPGTPANVDTWQP